MSQKPEEPEVEMPFLQHIFELRDRLMRIVLVILVLFLGLFSFSAEIYGFISEPLQSLLPEGSKIISTQVLGVFLTPLKLTLILAFYIAIPVTLYQVWSFVAPGLYKHERKLIYPLLISSVILFYAGMAFAYFVVLPLVFQFLTALNVPGATMMTDIGAYLDFVLKMFFAFGVAFEVPIATILLVWTGVTTPEKLSEKRPYIIVGAFVVGMLLTPPDIISQTLLAVPMWILFELGVIFSRMFYSKKPAPEEQAEADTQYDFDEDGNDIMPPSGGASEKASTEVDPWKDDPSGRGNGPITPESHNLGVDNLANAQAKPETAPESEPEQPQEDDSLVFADDEMNEWKPMSQEEMDAELDRLEAEETTAEDESSNDEGEEAGKKATTLDDASSPADDKEKDK